MAKRSQAVTTFLSSAAGIGIMAILLLAVNVIVGWVHLRVDLTEDKLYTLSPGSRAIVDKINSPVTIRFYYSKSNPDMAAREKNFAQRVDDLLKEYEIAAGGKIRVEKYDPQPDSDAEETASLDGITGRATSPFEGSDRIYLGLAVSSLGETEAMPQLSMQNEGTLEYDISQRIYRVANPGKPTIGIMSSLPVMGTPGSPQMAQFGMPNQGTPAWEFVTQLKKDFEVREVALDAETVPEDIKTLVVLHPKDISKRTEYAIDQFILKGGKLIALVDPFSFVEAQNQPQNPMMQAQGPGASSLETLFSAWGIRFTKDKIVADMKYPYEQMISRTQKDINPVVMLLPNDAMNKDDILSNSLDLLFVPWAGTFTGDPAEGLTKTVLISSSTTSQVVPSFKARVPGNAIMNDFQSEEKSQAIAIRLVGTFKTAFPDGQPAAESDGEATDGSGSADASLKVGTADGAVVLIGDSDILFDNFWIDQGRDFFGPYKRVTTDNNNFVRNCIEQLSGDSSLIAIRSRGVTRRPFEVIRDRELDAQKKYKAQIEELEKELQEAQTKINELQHRKKDEQQMHILSPEQEAELAKFQAKQKEARKTLKMTRKELRRDVEMIQLFVKLVDCLVMPMIVAIIGVVLAIIRRSKMRRA